jgi:ATP-dependent Zn protease
MPPFDAASRSSAKLRSLSRRPSAYLTYCAVLSALRSHREILHRRSGVIVFVVPSRWQLDLIQNAVDLCLGQPGHGTLDVATLLHKTARGKKGAAFEIEDAVRAQTLLVFIHDGVKLHDDLAVISDVTVPLEVCKAEHLRSLARSMRCGALRDTDIEYLQKLSDEAINLVFRRGKPVSEATDRHREQYARPPAQGKAGVRTSVGYGDEAGNWARQLKSDLDLWRRGSLPGPEIDKGVLLYGPPGTGKTRFAMALAHECDAHLVPGSYATWQAKGNLDDYLRAMYGAFAEAKEHAPSILLIDELDSIGSRSQRDDHNGGYHQKVIAALLEALDGVHDRDGVIVVGTTNLPENIDAAILRSGRLEKHIHVGLPDAYARAEILEVYLPSLSGHAGLGQLSKRLVGFSGADIERLCREARRKARKDGREPKIDDLQALVGDPTILTPEDRFRVAVHEAGHAVLAHILGNGKVTRVEIFDAGGELVSGSMAHGFTKIEPNSSIIDTRDSLSSIIVGWLGGLCAEDVIFGNRSSLSGGDAKSDIAIATDLAIKMIAELGLGPSLIYFPTKFPVWDPEGMLRDPYIHDRADSFLRDQYEVAHSILAGQKPLLIAMATALSEKRVLVEEELNRLFVVAGTTSAVITP